MGHVDWLVAATACAVTAAAGAWLSGLPLRRAANDPALAGRFHRHRARLSLIFLVSLVVPPLIVWSTSSSEGEPGFMPSALGVVLLASVGLLAGGYPLRRDLSGERNSLPGYVVGSVRFILAMYGFWLAVVCLPYGVRSAGAASPYVALGAGIALLMWARHLPWVTCVTLGVRPLADAEFERVMDRSSARRPAVFSFGNDRGSLVNAFALPSLRDPRILMSCPLLQRLTPPEAATVFAHELATTRISSPRRCGAGAGRRSC